MASPEQDLLAKAVSDKKYDATVLDSLGRLATDKKEMYKCPDLDCGKMFSRAEHLYQHQLNHTPKQIYHCDFPGCGRKFVRADLRARHKELHTAKESHSERKDVISSELAKDDTTDPPAAGSLFRRNLGSATTDQTPYQVPSIRSVFSETFPNALQTQADDAPLTPAVHDMTLAESTSNAHLETKSFALKNSYIKDFPTGFGPPPLRPRSSNVMRDERDFAIYEGVHGLDPRVGKTTGYICKACLTNSANPKWWPRLDNFKAHIDRKHENWDRNYLISISESERPVDSFAESGRAPQPLAMAPSGDLFWDPLSYTDGSQEQLIHGNQTLPVVKENIDDAEAIELEAFLSQPPCPSVEAFNEFLDETQTLNNINSQQSTTSTSRRRKLIGTSIRPLRPGIDSKEPIGKQPYIRPQHPKIYCEQCTDFPDGFRGEHEYRRHFDRVHTEYRKVWICVDPHVETEEGWRPIKPLETCKQCAQRKQYNVYYNAAAHLRRAHFFPRKRGRNATAGKQYSRFPAAVDQPPIGWLKRVGFLKEIEVKQTDAIHPFMDDDGDVHDDTEYTSDFDVHNDYHHLGLDHELLGLSVPSIEATDLSYGLPAPEDGLYDIAEASGKNDFPRAGQLNEMAAGFGADSSLDDIEPTVGFTRTDEGYCSLEKQQTDNIEEDTASDTDSIRTDNRDSGLQQHVKETLSSQFADELLENLKIHDQDIVQCAGRVSEMLPDLLREYSILLEYRARESLQERSSVFVRHQRKYITRSLKTSLLCRPDHSNIPDSLSKIELLWNRERNVHIHEHCEADEADDFLEDSKDFLDDGPIIPDLPHARSFLVDSVEFAWLLNRLQIATTMMSTGSVDLELRNHFLGIIGKGNQIRLTVDWSPRSFLSDQYDHPEEVELANVLCCTGHAADAYVTTCGEYIERMWPRLGRKVLDGLTGALRAQSSSHTVSCQDGASIEIMTVNHVSIAATGPNTTLLEIAEICAWLGAACRTSRDSERIMFCWPRVLPNERLHACTILYDYSDVNIDEHDEPLSANCWHQLFKNPTIVKGYPIPARDNGEKGAEISIAIMSTLAAARRVVHYMQALFIKGFCTMFVPVLQAGSSMVWHLVTNKDGSLLSYNQGLTHKPCSITSGPDTLETSRHFVGFMPSAKVLAGSKEANYDIKLSRTSPSKPGISALANINLGFDKIITANATFERGKKDTPLFITRLRDPYELQIKAATKINVIFYDTQSQQGWFLDGARALLHICRAWLSSENAEYSQQVLPNFEHATTLGNPTSAIEALNNMKNRQLPLFTTKGSIWTWEDLVESKWDALQQMSDRIALMQTSSQIDLSLPFGKPQLEGFEFHDVVGPSSQLRPRVACLQARATQWVDFAAQNETVNIFGSGFGDLILPTPANGILYPQCTRYQTMPAGMDYLCCPLYVLQKIAEKHRDSQEHSIRLSHSIFWTNHRDYLQDCDCKKQCTRKCTPLLSKLDTSQKGFKKKTQQGNVFEMHPEGAVTFGQVRNILQKASKQITGKRSADDPSSLAFRNKKARGSDSGIDVGTSNSSQGSSGGGAGASTGSSSP